MSETKFTPGPWSVGRRECTAPDYAEISHVGGPHQHIALADVVVGLDGEPYQQGEANARLIAAAPELYEALERLNNAGKRLSDNINEFGKVTDPIFQDDVDNAVIAADAALAKARGE